MKPRSLLQFGPRMLWATAVSGFALFAVAAAFSAPPTTARAALGGPHGQVRKAGGVPVEGVGVQLISQKTAIRTTVYTSEDGQFEFPKLESGLYTLRVPRPMEFKPYVKEGIRIDGAPELEAIQLENVSTTEFLPPTPEILAQLTGAEWMMSLPGTGEEKRVFTVSCGFACHSYQQIFRNHYDERSWKLIFQRMIRSGSSPLIVDTKPTATTKDRAGRLMLEDEDFMAKWLATVRGPETKDPPIAYLPRAHGRATHVVVTEYELPRELLAPHDVHADSRGNIWYTAHRSAYSGVLNPSTGAVTQYRIPGKDEDTVGALPGTHRVWVDKQDIVWFWEGWDNFLTGLDSKTGKIVKRYPRGKIENLNSPGGEGGPNFAMDAAGFVYQINRGEVLKTDTKTGDIVQRYPLKKTTSTYDNIVTPDGRYWAGGLSYLDMKTGESWEPEVSPELVVPARGGFDPSNNAWFGGRGGMLLKHDAVTHRITEYYPPIPFDTLYEAMPDKNGEVWAGGIQSGRMWRYNPKTEQWTGYPMPEPYAHDRRTWIDNSTSPVTVWFVDNDGYMVRVQPLD